MTFVVCLTKFMTPKGHGIIRDRRKLLYNSKGQFDLCGRFDLVYDHKKVKGSLEVNGSYFMTKKVNLTFDHDLDLKVNHLTWQVTTNVQATL